MLCEPPVPARQISMRVVIDAINDNADLRGPDRYLIGLLRGLAARPGGHDYVVLHAPWQTFFHGLGLPGCFRFQVCRPPRGRLRRVLWHALRLRTVVQQAGADVVHLPNVIFAPALGVPTLMTVHDLAHFRSPEKFGLFRGYLQRGLIRMAVRLADRLIAVSEFTRCDLHRILRLPDGKTVVIGEAGPEPLDLQAPPAWRPYFLYVGRVERSKNIETLVAAFAGSEPLARAGVVLKIAGSAGNASGRVQALAASLAPGRVQLLGHVAEGELPGLYAAALAFVFPSLVEGFGLVLLEAMAYGAPVVAADATVIPEVVGDAALLVDGRDAAALRRALESVHADPALREELRRRGRLRLTAFSWQDVADATRAEYERLAA